jgi:hypothetical protein
MKKERENWFEPFLNIHTPLSPHFHLIFLFAHLQLDSQKKSFGCKNIVGSYAPLPKVTPVMNAILL